LTKKHRGEADPLLIYESPEPVAPKAMPE